MVAKKLQTAEPVTELDPVLLAKLLEQFGTHHMSRANFARFGYFVPPGIGLCNDKDEYCFELTDAMVAYLGKQGWRGNLVTYTASVFLRGSWFVTRTLANIAASVLFMRRVRIESALTRDGVGLQLTMSKPRDA